MSDVKDIWNEGVPIEKASDEGCPSPDITGECFTISTSDKDCFSISTSDDFSDSCFTIRCVDDKPSVEFPPPPEIDLAYLGIQHIYSLHFTSTDYLYLVADMNVKVGSNWESHTFLVSAMYQINAGGGIYSIDGIYARLDIDDLIGTANKPRDTTGATLIGHSNIWSGSLALRIEYGISGYDKTFLFSTFAGSLEFKYMFSDSHDGTSRFFLEDGLYQTGVYNKGTITCTGETSSMIYFTGCDLDGETVTTDYCANGYTDNSSYPSNMILSHFFTTDDDRVSLTFMNHGVERQRQAFNHAGSCTTYQYSSGFFERCYFVHYGDRNYMGGDNFGTLYAGRVVYDGTYFGYSASEGITFREESTGVIEKIFPYSIADYTISSGYMLRVSTTSKTLIEQLAIKTLD